MVCFSTFIMFITLYSSDYYCIIHLPYFIVPQLDTFTITAISTSAIKATWNVFTEILVDNYTLQYIRLCDNMSYTKTFDAFSDGTVVSGLNQGLQYLVSLTPMNCLGAGIGATKMIYLNSIGILFIEQ